MMHYDPTLYYLHNGLIEAIDYDAEQQQLILHLDYNLALAVNYDPTSPDDDFRQTRLIFAGVESIPPELPIMTQKINAAPENYGDILECNWSNHHDYATVEILINFFAPMPKTEEFMQILIRYQTVEWQIDPPQSVD